MTEDEMVGWHHRLNGHEFEQAPGNGERQGSLACCWFNVGKSASHRRLPLGPEMLLDLSTSSRPRPTFHQLPSVTVAAICPPGDQPVLARCRAESRGHRNDSQWLSRRGRELCVSWQPTGEESTGV